jgi:hypothetical protein
VYPSADTTLRNPITGVPAQLKRLTKEEQRVILSDPQLLNSYGYARDNPITNKDATGLISVKTFYRGLEIVSNFLLGQSAATKKFFEFDADPSSQENCNQ